MSFHHQWRLLLGWRSVILTLQSEDFDHSFDFHHYSPDLACRTCRVYQGVVPILCDHPVQSWLWIFERSHSCSWSSRNMLGGRDIWRYNLKSLIRSFDGFALHLNILVVAQVTDHIFFFAIDCDNLFFYWVF